MVTRLILCSILAVCLGPTWASGSIPAAPEEDQSQSPTGGIRVTDPLPQPGVWAHMARTGDRRAIVTASDPGPGLLSDIAWTADKDETGALMEFTGPGGVVVDKKHVFAGARIGGNHHAVAVDRETGLTSWSTPLPPPVFNSWASPAVDLNNGTVIYSVFDTLFALERKTGSVVWTAPLESLLVNASPVVTTDLGPADQASTVPDVRSRAPAVATYTTPSRYAGVAPAVGWPSVRVQTISPGWYGLSAASYASTFTQYSRPGGATTP